MRWSENPRIRPSTSLRYAQGERKFLLTLAFPFVLSPSTSSGQAMPAGRSRSMNGARPPHLN